MSAALKQIASVREQVSAEEWQVRCDLAATYRLIARQGWDDLIYTHISARVPGDHDHFLINPLGLHFHEISASSLVKVDHKGEIVMDTEYPINPAGFIVHGAVHMKRHDAGCVIHTHTPAGCAVSAQKFGLLPITQLALYFYGNVAYHDYEGIAVAPGELERLGEDLGDKQVMILRNHGLLTTGRTCAAAYVAMYFLEKACKAQVQALSAGHENIHYPSQESQEAVCRQAAMAFKAIGTLEWAGLIRTLDREDPSYKS